MRRRPSHRRRPWTDTAAADTAVADKTADETAAECKMPGATIAAAVVTTKERRPDAGHTASAFCLTSEEQGAAHRPCICRLAQSSGGELTPVVDPPGSVGLVTERLT